MCKYCLRIITDSCNPEIESAIIHFLQSLPGTFRLHAEPLKPYWKNPEQGELCCSFVSDRPIEKIRAALAEHWHTEVADACRNRVFVPPAAFLWLTQ